MRISRLMISAQPIPIGGAVPRSLTEARNHVVGQLAQQTANFVVRQYSQSGFGFICPI
ncbi:hypothetical protein [Ruegeria sp. AD91A]|uniref:hypothetical protein n=1 Tax=Ruegeria sp. AD91A TaxID=2293862 RepID=UPI00352AFF27